MHAPNGRAIFWILNFAVLVTLGCRGSNPLGRYVQVTKTADADVPDIEVPPQRLATAKPRVADDSMSMDQNPHLASNRATVSDKSNEPSVSAEQTPDPQSVSSAAVSKRSPSTYIPARPVSSRQASDTSVAATGRPSKNEGASQVSQTSGTTAVTISDASTPPQTHDAESTADAGNSHSGQSKTAAGQSKTGTGQVGSAELLAIIQEFPPELRQQALRQFIAAASLSASQTDQPNELLSELANMMRDLPTLPEPSTTPPAVAPKRIAASPQDSGDALAVVSISDVPSSSESEKQIATTASLSDTQGGELESVQVQPISESIESDGGVVKTASAALLSDQALTNEVAETKDPVTDSSTEQAIQAEPQHFSDQQMLDELVKRLSTGSSGESEAERSARLIKLRHLMVLAGDPDSAVAHVDGMAEAEQEYLRHQLLGLWTMIDPQGHPVPSRRFTSAIPQIREAAKFAAAATDSLDVRSLAFCTEIESYGQITPFSGNRFKPEQQVILYCEIENFTVRKVDNGYHTKLQGSYDVYNSKNEKVFSQVLPVDEQISANFLRDYFIAYQMYLPSELEPGTYRMQLTMEDANGRKYGQADIPFEIAR